ncbi:MAG: hypothetical protein HKP56_12705, partial [Anderseniella sp.]|nr:hypothetical protein [Anderseniella sp.]
MLQTNENGPAYPSWVNRAAVPAHTRLLERGQQAIKSMAEIRFIVSSRASASADVSKTLGLTARRALR